MPTAAKLISALYFAALFYIAGQVYIAAAPAGLTLSGALPKLALVAALVGWRVMGNDAAGSLAMNIAAGLRTALAVVFWALLLNALAIMLRRAFVPSYHTMFEAFDAAIVYFLDYGRAALTADLGLLLILGGGFGGVLVGFIGKRWS